MTADEYLKTREEMVSVLYESATIESDRLHGFPLKFPEVMRREIMLAFSSGFEQATKGQAVVSDE